MPPLGPVNLPLIDTPVEMADQVIPSSNSEMARGVFRYGIISGDEPVQEQALTILSAVIPRLDQHPLVFGNWEMLLADYLFRPLEVANVGEDYRQILQEIHRHYLPGILLYGGPDDTALETLRGKHKPGKTLIYLCRGKSCESPVESVPELLEMLNNWQGRVEQS